MLGISESLPLSANRLLARLPEADLRRISPLLKAVPLPVKQVVYRAQSPIDWVYFPTDGIVSAMTVMSDGSAIEVATIGKEGMVGLTAFMGGETSPNEVIVQVVGQGFRMQVASLKEEVNRNPHLQKILVHYNTAYSVQVSYSVACNGLHTVEKRCCRWLLMTSDRIGSNLLPLTHEFLAIMLGVRRPSVTEVLRPLQERGLVRNGRGEIEIVDRPGLEGLACECYRAVNQEFARLFG